MSDVKTEAEIQDTLTQRLRRALYDESKDLTGKLCTLIDSAIANERQVKATKDIVRQVIRDSTEQKQRRIQWEVFDFSRKPNGELMPDWLIKRLTEEYGIGYMTEAAGS